MAETESLEAQTLQVEQKQQVVEEQNGVSLGVEEEELENDGGEEEDSQLSEFDSHQQLQSVSNSATILSENDQCVGLKDNNSALERHVGEAELEEQDDRSQADALGSVTIEGAEAQAPNQLQSSLCPTSLSELSPTSVTQPISSARSPTLPEPRSSPYVNNNVNNSETDQQNSSGRKNLSLPIVRAHVPDGYNWRKYGQKQVKSPSGSRSYYRCTHSDCSAKKIECSDHSGHVIEIVNKGTHSHDPPRKNNCTRESKVLLSPVLGSSKTEPSIAMHTDSNLSTLLSKESPRETPIIPERKRQKSSASDENGGIKEEDAIEPEPKRRVKENGECSETLLKPGKKPKFIVHAAGDVGISGDGYRWRKYGQKMVKGNPNPRNYYRCTSAGCPVRKHIETAVDNTDAVIITYKGVHDHDRPVPKKRHGPPSAPLVAAAAPSCMNSTQLQKSDISPNQATSTQWSVGKEGELTSEKLDSGGEKEKAIESARTLLSIGFEIKPC